MHVGGDIVVQIPLSPLPDTQLACSHLSLISIVERSESRRCRAKMSLLFQSDLIPQSAQDGIGADLFVSCGQPFLTSGRHSYMSTAATSLPCQCWKLTPQIRPLQSDDHKRGHLDVLKVLTAAPQLTPQQYEGTSFYPQIPQTRCLLRCADIQRRLQSYNRVPTPTTPSSLCTNPQIPSSAAARSSSSGNSYAELACAHISRTLP